MAGTTGGTPRARALGAQLRQHRQARFKGSLREFADFAGVHHSILSRWETGSLLPSPEQVAHLTGVLRLGGDEQKALSDEAVAARNPYWLASGVDRQVSALIEFEKTATRMVSVAPLIMTGMLHTEGTARAILMGSGYSEPKINSIVTARMGRKEALIRPAPLPFESYLGMRAVTRELGGRDCAINQLRYVEKISAQPNVTVRVINEVSDFTPADMGAFLYYELPGGGDPIAYFEHYRSSMFAPKRDVPDMTAAVKWIEETAMSADDTLELIADVIKRMER